MRLNVLTDNIFLWLDETRSVCKTHHDYIPFHQDRFMGARIITGMCFAILTGFYLLLVRCLTTAVICSLSVSK